MPSRFILLTISEISFEYFFTRVEKEEKAWEQQSPPPSETILSAKDFKEAIVEIFYHIKNGHIEEVSDPHRIFIKNI